MDGQVITTKSAVCSVLSPMFLGIFEGIKAYVQGDVSKSGNLNVFRWKEHVGRLWRSARVSYMDIPYSKDELLVALRETINANGFTKNTYIQPRIWPKIHKDSYRPERDLHVVIAAVPFETALTRIQLGTEKKHRLTVSTWRRIASDALPPQNKSFGNYVNSRLGENEAERLGFDGCLFLDNRGFVSEGGGSCVMLIKNGVLVTPPVTASILDSVTRDSILTFAREDLQIPTEARDITRVELYDADELFMCGTGAEIRPVSSIDDQDVGTTYPGEITTRIAKYFADIVTGNVSKRANWLIPV